MRGSGRASPQPNSASTNALGSKSSRSSIPSPTPTNRTGTFRASSMANAMPPRDVVSSLVRTMPRQAGRLVERLGLGEAVLAGRRVEHEEDLGRRVAAAACRWCAGSWPAPPSGCSWCAAGRPCRPRRRLSHVPPRHPARRRPRPMDPRRRCAQRRAGLPLRPRLELLDGRGAERVGGGQQDSARRASRSGWPELGDGRRLARAVDADDQHDGGHARCGHARPGRRVAGREEREQLGCDRGLGVSNVLPVARRSTTCDRQRRADVGRDERLLDLLPRGVVEWCRRGRRAACR